MKKEQKKQNIIDSSIKEFANKGYEYATIADISKTADIAVGSVYNYFKNKSHLFEQIIFYIYNKLVDGLKEMATSSDNKLDNILNFTLTFFKTKIDYAKLLLIEMHNYAIRYPNSELWNLNLQLNQLLMSELEKDLDIPHNIKPEIYLSLIVGGMKHIMIHWIFHPESLNIKDTESLKNELFKIINKK